MALPQKLKTSPTRIVGTDLGNTIPAKLGTLESALCDIFGYTADTDITESAFLLDNSGNMTKALIRQVAAGPVGWRFRNSNNNKEMRICVNGTNLDFDENTGTEGSPSWANRFRIAIGTGALTGAAFTSSTAGLAPASDGDSSHYLSADGTYTAPPAASATSVRLRNSTTQNITSASFTAISFNTEDWDDAAYHSGSAPTRITFPSDGKYMLVGQIGFSANATGRRILDVRIGGSSIIARAEVDPNSANQTFVTVTGIFNAVAGNYAELVAYQNSGSTLTTVATASYSPQFAAYKIGG